MLTNGNGYKDILHSCLVDLGIYLLFTCSMEIVAESDFNSSMLFYQTYVGYQQNLSTSSQRMKLTFLLIRLNEHLLDQRLMLSFHTQSPYLLYPQHLDSSCPHHRG